MLRVRQIKVSVLNDTPENIENSILHKLKINKDELKSYTILKKSIDARDKNDINFIYEVKVDVNNESFFLKRNNNDIVFYEEKSYHFITKGNIKLNKRPIIVGAGPAGLLVEQRRRNLSVKHVEVAGRQSGRYL